MKTSFSTLYNMKGSDGDVMVRTPSFGEMTQFLVKNLAIALHDKLRKPCGKPCGKPRPDLLAVLDLSIKEDTLERCAVRIADMFFFNACPCGDDDCRTWPFVFDVFSGRKYACISECELKALPESESEVEADPDVPPEGETLEAYLARNISVFMADPNVVQACLDETRLVPGTDRNGVYLSGYAEAMQDVLGLVKGTKPKGKVDTDGV